MKPFIQPFILSASFGAKMKAMTIVKSFVLMKCKLFQWDNYDKQYVKAPCKNW